MNGFPRHIGNSMRGQLTSGGSVRTTKHVGPFSVRAKKHPWTPRASLHNEIQSSQILNGEVPSESSSSTACGFKMRNSVSSLATTLQGTEYGGLSMLREIN